MQTLPAKRRGAFRRVWCGLAAVFATTENSCKIYENRQNWCDLAKVALCG